jgi:hypothetical protein
MGYFPASYNQARDVTESDTVNFDLNLNGGLCDALWIGGAGIVQAVFQDGSTANFTCAAGTVLPIRCKRFNAASTASLVVALYSV